MPVRPVNAFFMLKFELREGPATATSPKVAIRSSLETPEILVGTGAHTYTPGVTEYEYEQFTGKRRAAMILM